MLVLVIHLFLHFPRYILHVARSHLLKQLHASLSSARVSMIEPGLRQLDHLAVPHAAQLCKAVDGGHARQRVEVLQHSREFSQAGKVIQRRGLRQRVRRRLPNDPGPIIAGALLKLQGVLVAPDSYPGYAQHSSPADGLVPVVQAGSDPVNSLTAALAHQRSDGFDRGFADRSHLVLQKHLRCLDGLPAAKESPLRHGVHGCSADAPVLVLQPRSDRLVHLQVEGGTPGRVARLARDVRQGAQASNARPFASAAQFFQRSAHSPLIAHVCNFCHGCLCCQLHCHILVAKGVRYGRDGVGVVAELSEAFHGLPPHRHIMVRGILQELLLGGGLCTSAERAE
mmetsp:Transcript_35078/g.76594  ORF Transcript_35078/g.76594 Transcript_35078/m.76594 type:complete len:340 (-) Transcript_35078:204-1223(-)